MCRHIHFYPLPVTANGRERWQTCCETQLDPAYPGRAGRGGVRYLCLSYPLLGGACFPSVFIKVCLSHRSVVLPARGITASTRANVEGQPARRPVDLFFYSRRVSTLFLSLVFLTWATRCAMCSSTTRRAVTVRTHTPDNLRHKERFQPPIEEVSINTIMD